MSGRLLTDAWDRRIPVINGFDDDRNHPTGTVPERNTKSPAFRSTPRPLRGYNVPHTGVGDYGDRCPPAIHRCVGFGILIAVRIAGTRTNAWRPRGPVGGCCLGASRSSRRTGAVCDRRWAARWIPHPNANRRLGSDRLRCIVLSGRVQTPKEGRRDDSGAGWVSPPLEAKNWKENWRLSPWATRSYDETLAQSRWAANRFCCKPSSYL